ncbi:MAG: tRNA adenosine(34) deaminase TadA [Rhodospirillales bacterium]|jgi:tRNA(adenine34) deaminase|nr:tRNA adenosine(34) deaminase TadA [Rhodospirillales bacterium]
MSWSEADTRFMMAAIAEAEVAASTDEVPVGAVIVKGGEIIARGLNRPVENNDPTAHAEIMAIRAAAAVEKNYRLNGATLYVTLEPCLMCVGAMLHARVSRLVFGAYDPKSGAAGSVLDLCDDRRMNHRIEVNGGLLEDQCGGLLRQFFERKR